MLPTLWRKGTLLLCCWKHKLVTASLEDRAPVISDVPSSKRQPGVPADRVLVSPTRSPNHGTQSQHSGLRSLVLPAWPRTNSGEEAEVKSEAQSLLKREVYVQRGRGGRRDGVEPLKGPVLQVFVFPLANHPALSSPPPPPTQIQCLRTLLWGAHKP